ncbi:phage DNA ejection protein [Salmonella enterica]|nr:DNA transfer protein [Salmonella enterica]EHP5362574.1 phage DNA ejection protein [Salmonella enterica]
MATWQQGISSGGFLAGIGAQNSNAPKASDVNTALAYIRANNEMQRSGQNNLGLQALQGLGSVYQAYQQQQANEQQQAFQNDYASAMQSGDRQQIRDLMTKYPGQMEKIQSGMKWADDDQRATVGNLAASARLASSSPEAMGDWLKSNAADLQRVGLSPQDIAQTYQQNPQQFGEFADHLGMAALGPAEYFAAQDKIAGRDIDRGRLAETIRSNQAGEALQARGQNITMRGQDMSASTARRGQDLAMQRANARTISGVDGNRVVQLADGRTVNIDGKLHGAGANAFYEGIDDNGNMVRVPASAIAAPPTSAASAQNYAMKKDIDAIANADASALDFMTGMTGGAGNPAIGADVRSRLTGKEQRQLYNSAQRIQGRMQNQGVAAARDMGASGINTIAEAKMYFQGMPQVDYSSPEAMQQSIREIQEYTNNYNQQYNVNVDNGGQKSSRQQPATQQSVGGSYTSKSGIQFTVE